MWVICHSSPTQHLALSHVEHFLHQTESTFGPRHGCATSARCCIHVEQDSVCVRVSKKAPCDSPGRRLLETLVFRSSPSNWTPSVDFFDVSDVSPQCGLRLQLRGSRWSPGRIPHSGSNPSAELFHRLCIPGF